MPECYPIKSFGYKLYRASIANNHGCPLGGTPLGGTPLKGICSANKGDYVFFGLDLIYQILRPEPVEGEAVLLSSNGANSPLDKLMVKPKGGQVLKFYKVSLYDLKIKNLFYVLSLSKGV